MSDFLVVYVTVGSPAEADRLAQALVKERLAACVNRIHSVRSVYRWQGQVEQSEEELLIIKTKRNLWEPLKNTVRNLHSYSVPEIIALPVVEGNESYLQWIDDELQEEGK